MSVQLVRVGDGTLIWGKPYDLVRADLLSLQDYDGQRAQAKAVLSAMSRNAPGDRRAQAILASVLAADGDRPQAGMLVRTLTAPGVFVDHHVMYSLGVARCCSSTPDESLMLLNHEFGFSAGQTLKCSAAPDRRVLMDKRRFLDSPESPPETGIASGRCRQCHRAASALYEAHCERIEASFVLLNLDAGVPANACCQPRSPDRRRDHRDRRPVVDAGGRPGAGRPSAI